METLAAHDSLFAPLASESSMLEIPPSDLASLMAQCPSTVDTTPLSGNNANTSTLAASSFDWELPLAPAQAAFSTPALKPNTAATFSAPAAGSSGAAAANSMLDLSFDSLFALRGDAQTASSPVSSLSDGEASSYSGSLDDGFAHLDLPDFLMEDVAAAAAAAPPPSTTTAFVPMVSSSTLAPSGQQQQSATLEHQLLRHVSPPSPANKSRPAAKSRGAAKRRSPSSAALRSASANSNGSPPAKRSGRRPSVSEEEDEMLARASTELSQSIRPEDITRARKGAAAAGLEAEETARRLSLKAARERAAAERCGFSLTEDGEFENPEEKRTVMNILERARREDLKTCFHRLRDVIPELTGKASASKGAILKRGAEIIAQLELEGQALEAQLNLMRMQCGRL